MTYIHGHDIPVHVHHLITCTGTRVDPLDDRVESAHTNELVEEEGRKEGGWVVSGP